MKKGKSVYRFQFNCPPQNVNAVVQGWLQANQFTFQNKYGENMFYYHDAWNGNRGFLYFFHGNVLTIYAWTIGVGKQFWMLESGALGNMAGDSYMHILHSLFTGISNLGAVAAAPVQAYAQPREQYYAQPQEQYYNQPQNPYYSQYREQTVNEVLNNMDDELTKKAETGCEVGFWLSIFGLLISFVGITYGVIVYIAIFYLGSRGLKTRKRGKAIASIVMASLSILITIVIIFLNL